MIKLIHYQTCKAEYHPLSRQRITFMPMALVQYLALTTCDILPYKLDNNYYNNIYNNSCDLGKGGGLIGN